MAKTMIATQEMTDGQIENAVSKLRDALRKHRSEISSEVAQQILGIENLGMIMFAPFRECAEAASPITRTVTVDRTRTAQQALDATGRLQLTSQGVVNAMPNGKSRKVKVVFFKPKLSTRGGYISDNGLEDEFRMRGLKPADPFTLAAFNEFNPAFADDKPHATHWKDSKDNWYFATFFRGGDERQVKVYPHTGTWGKRWWFAGVRR